jgi:release factor glutamine methyltransferase
MTIKEWLVQAEQRLKLEDITTARLDSLVLLSDKLNKSKAWILANDDTLISSEDQRVLAKLVDQRSKHIPLAFVRGKTEFYGRNFVINSHVLEPRPESETMIDLLKSLPLNGSKRTTLIHLLDIGTGSGALAITSQLELNNAQVDACDIDEKALEVAKSNVDLFTLNISVIKSDLLSSISKSYEVFLCNLPYVPDDFAINRAAMHEPELAIYGGPDGLDLYRKLFNQLMTYQNKPLYILSESLPPQHSKLAEIALKSGYTVHSEEDFIQVFELQSK